MADRSTIEWTEATWNPVTGCTKVSPGCAHCYAERFAERFRGTAGHPYEQGFDLRLWPGRLGVSIENSRWVRRADFLRQVDEAAVRFISAEPLLGRLEGLELDGIDWVIAGGESGARHRPVREEWLVDLRDRCAAAGIPYFFKQWGGVRPKSGGRLLEGEEWSEMPSLSA
jgi:protein gp37